MKHFPLCFGDPEDGSCWYFSDPSRVLMPRGGSENFALFFSGSEEGKISYQFFRCLLKTLSKKKKGGGLGVRIWNDARFFSASMQYLLMIFLVWL